MPDDGERPTPPALPGLAWESAGARPSSIPDIERLAQHIERTYGLRADGASIRRLRATVAERARASRQESVEAYLGLVSSEPVEMDQLLAHYVVAETAFFRTAAHFEQLARGILPRLDKILPRGEPLRLWSAGCATGEEAYSLAMVCADTLGSRRPFEVLATDINPAALAAGRAALYSRRAVEKAPPRLASRYLEPLGTRFRVADCVARHVRFERLNLAAPSPPGALGGRMHVITCENVLIYFLPALMERALAHLTAALAPGGYLFLGYSEFLPPGRPGMEIVWLGDTPAWRKAGSKNAAPASGDAPAPAPRRRAVETEQATTPRALAELRLTAARVSADRGHFAEALELAHQAIALAPTWEQAYSLLGTIRAAQNDIAEAVAAFERALYLAPRDPLIRFHYATLLRECGHTDHARREFASLASRLAGFPPDHPLGDFTAGLLLRICQEQAG